MKTTEILKVVPLWKQEKQNTVKKSTYFNYCMLLQKNLMPLLESNKNLDNKIVQDYVLNLNKQGLSIKSCKCIMVVLNNILRYGAENDYFNYKKFKIKYPSNTEKSETLILTKQQHKQVLDYISSNFTFKNLGIYLCLTGGLRIGEVCALTWQDIDIEKQVITVKKTLQRIYSQEDEKLRTVVFLDTAKTINSQREVPLSSSAVKLLKSIMKFVNLNYYVLSNNEKPIEPRCYRNYYKRFMKMLNLPSVKFHSLRHTFATRCVESSCDYKTLSCRLGHSNITTTLNLYAHPNLEQKRKVINKMLKSV